jgi:hypothetical protein
MVAGSRTWTPGGNVFLDLISSNMNLSIATEFMERTEQQSGANHFTCRLQYSGPIID